MGAGRGRLIWLRPVALLYALLAGALVFAGAELLNSETGGPWVEVGDAALLGLAVLTGGLFVRTALVRRREGLVRRAWGWLAAAAGSGLVALAATLVLATSYQVGSTLTGADVRLTRPILDGLPVPPQATKVSEHPGLAGSESVVADYRVPDLSTVPAFYRDALPKAGWRGEDTSSDSLLRYRKGDFIVMVVMDLSGGSHDYSVTVDRSPAPAASATVSPS